uniref:ATP synthase F0 subunit 8 n=1 Tax=Vagitanus terminalis TaxID=2170276 RepID=A0A344AM11_9HEMI|nr:ATP synthase F0 subunit 8 [Vagitanus terminalis]
MPQMSPINWLILMLFFISMMLFLIVLMYYLNTVDCNMSICKKETNYMSWMW